MKSAPALFFRCKNENRDLRFSRSHYRASAAYRKIGVRGGERKISGAIGGVGRDNLTGRGEYDYGKAFGAYRYDGTFAPED